MICRINVELLFFSDIQRLNYAVISNLLITLLSGKLYHRKVYNSKVYCYEINREIVDMKFYNREKELASLEKARHVSFTVHSQMTVLTGRRRIGKTSLIFIFQWKICRHEFNFICNWTIGDCPIRQCIDCFN